MPALLWSKRVPAKKVGAGGWGVPGPRPPSRQTGEWEDEPLKPWAGGSAPGSNQEGDTTCASGHVVTCPPVSHRMWPLLPGDAEGPARPGPGKGGWHWPRTQGWELGSGTNRTRWTRAASTPHRCVTWTSKMTDLGLRLLGGKMEMTRPRPWWLMTEQLPRAPCLPTCLPLPK